MGNSITGTQCITKYWHWMGNSIASFEICNTYTAYQCSELSVSLFMHSELFMFLCACVLNCSCFSVHLFWTVHVFLCMCSELCMFLCLGVLWLPRSLEEEECFPVRLQPQPLLALGRSQQSSHDRKQNGGHRIQGEYLVTLSTMIMLLA